MTLSWREAAQDLGIRFDAPFAMEHGGARHWCAGWLPDFGGARGAIIAGPESVDEIFEVAQALGHYAASLSPHHYETFDRNLFVETLNDWGWFANPAQAPLWFRGAFGRHGGRR